MSDLAPFVAAALGDKVVAELKDENKRLKQENSRLQREKGRLEITGRHGTPVYAYGNFQDAEVDRPIPEIVIRNADFTCPDTSLCAFTNITNAEIYLSGSRIAVLRDRHFERFNSVGREDGHGRIFCWLVTISRGVEYVSKVTIRLHLTIGPMPDPTAEHVDVSMLSDSDIREVNFLSLLWQEEPISP